MRSGHRRQTPGRPVTWGVSDEFLDHFGLESIKALPGVEELKAAGLLDRRPGLGLVATENMPDPNEPEDEPYEAVEPDAAIPLDE